MGGSSNGEIFPYDVIIDILKRLPVKSLIRFNSVSKDWSKLLRTHHFITHHLLHHSLQNPFLLLQRVPHPSPTPTSTSTSTSSSFCLIGQDLKLHNSRFLDFISNAAKVVGSCNGLLCLRHTDNTLSICNPATRRFRQVPRTLINTEDFYYVGFGFSPIVNDYKIVRVSVCEFGNDNDDQVVLLDKIHVNRVEVYSLATGSWREIDASNLQDLCLISNSVAADGALFWKAAIISDFDSIHHNTGEFVASFDIGREVFTLLKGPPPPPSATTQSCSNVLAVYNNKLAMFHHFVIGNFQGSSIDLWVLDNTKTCASDSDGERWIKQHSIGPFSRMIYPQIIWRDEIVCQEELSRHTGESGRVETALSLFNPCSNELKNLTTHRNENCYVPFTYAESLVQVLNIQLQQ